MLEELRTAAVAKQLDHVFLPGRVDDPTLYYRAADVLALPGRGGMVISEAMTHGLPVIVHEADGTERDLVRHRETGIRLQRGDADEMRHAIEHLAAHPELAGTWGAEGRRLVESVFSIDRMVVQFERAVGRARDARRTLAA